MILWTVAHQAPLSMDFPDKNTGVGCQLYFSRYCIVRLKNFFFNFCFFFMHYLCEKYYKPITIQYSIADSVSWVPRLTVLDL